MRLSIGGNGSYSFPQRTALAPSGSPVVVAAGGAYKAFPTLCVMPNGELLSAYRGEATAHASVDGNILGKVSTDDGDTWGSPFTIVDSATDARDPSLTTLSDGRIACSYFEYNGTAGTGVFVTFSDDNAATWDTPVEMASTFTLEVACSAPIFEFGSVLIQPIYGRNGATFDAACLFSTDAGSTWGNQTDIAAGGGHDWTEPWIVRTFSGALLCLIRVFDVEEIQGTYSTDAASTWTTPFVAFTGDSRASPFVDSAGTIFTLYRKSAADPDGLYRNSLDDGATWTAPTLWTSAVFEYAAAVELPSGRKVAAWAEEASSSDADVYLSEIA